MSRWRLQASELRKLIEENEQMYKELLDQFQRGFLSQADYQVAARKNRDENQRLRDEFKKVNTPYAYIGV